MTDATTTVPPASSPQPPPLLLAIVAWQALPAIFPRASKQVGGAETGLWTLARSLRSVTGLRVAIATTACQGKYPAMVDNVELWIHFDRFARTRKFVSEHVDVRPKLRVKRFHPRLIYQLPWLLVTKPLRQADPPPMQPDRRLRDRLPDVWAAFSVTGDAARMVATALDQGRPSLIFVQSNADLEERLAGNESFISLWGDTAAERRFVLRNATEIICQTTWQLQTLADRFGRRGKLIRNPIDVSTWRQPTSSDAPYALWIGRYDDFHKRPLTMLRAAAACPGIPFKMIINRADSQIEEEVRSLRPPNVQVIDYVPFDEMPNWFAGARLFVSTGSPACEGFPNVLLQAAASRTPIISLEDFDGFLAQSGAGASCAGSVDRLAEEIQAHWQQGQIDWGKVDRYVQTHHDHRQIAAQVRELIERVVRRDQPDCVTVHD